MIGEGLPAAVVPGAGLDPMATCDRCEERMHDVHCKIVCPRCGHMRDCSDP